MAAWPVLIRTGSITFQAYYRTHAGLAMLGWLLRQRQPTPPDLELRQPRYY